MFITIDPYYTNSFYNECKEALKNNSVEFKQFINIKAPYNWYFELKQKPLMINFDEISTAESRWLVSTVVPLKPNEEYLFLRRENDKGKKALLKFIENVPMKEARLSNYAVFFTVKNREELEQLTKNYYGKIWYFGKYYNNKYRVCLATHETISGLLDRSQILLERDSAMEEPGRFESELNWKVFRGNDYLIKHTETPYFQDGVYYRPSIRGPDNNKLSI